MRPPVWMPVLAGLTGLAVADVPWFTDREAYNAGALGDAPNQTFRSSPIIAPIFQVSTLDTDAIDPASYLFIEWRYEGVGSPMIFRSDDLSLVYADQKYPWVKGTRVQTMNRRKDRYLTFWEGIEAMRYGEGRCLVFDEEYKRKYTITPIGLSPGQTVDLHECQVTDEGTFIISVYESIPFDLTPIGGPADGVLLDSVFQEIDPEANALVFQWRASEHYSIEDTTATIAGDTLPGGFDFFHINSIAKYGLDYLVGSAAFNQAILVDGSDASTVWTLGGQFNDFEDLSEGRATQFFRQHTPRFLEDKSQVTIFDNGFASANTVGCTTNCSRGLHARLDYDAMTAEVVTEYFQPLSLQSLAQGGYTTLESGNALIAWGTQPGYTEHRADQVVMDIQSGRIVNEYHPEWNSAYRVYKGDWVGKPRWDPSIAVDGKTVYVSWNGATEIASWIVLGSDRPHNINGRGKVLRLSKRMGFETAIPLGQKKVPRYLRAAAVNKEDRIIGSTAVWDTITGKTTSVDDKVTSYE